MAKPPDDGSLWTIVVATGILSGVASFLMTTARESYREWRLRRKAARYGAMRCAVELENFAADCWHIINMAEGHFSAAQEAFSTDLPSAPMLPPDIDWKALDGDMADRILSFVTSRNIARSEAMHARVYEGNPFDFDEAARTLGFRAIELASDLRTRYHMKPAPEFERLQKRLK